MLLLANPGKCSPFGTDAIPNLEGLHLIENTNGPALVRQLEETHSIRKRMNEIMEDAQYSRIRNRGTPQILNHGAEHPTRGSYQLSRAVLNDTHLY